MKRAPLALTLIGFVWCASLMAEEPTVSGRKVLTSQDNSLRYSNSFALIIGVNYQGRTFADTRDKLALPALGNAEGDAKSIHDLLIQHYGYHKENVQLLVGDQAGDDAINREIGRLVDPQRVGPDDSVLLFFAGHGFQLRGEQRDRAAIFPYDVALSGGNPIDNYVRLYSDLFLKLKSSPARHKLVILDSCYSGEILKSGFYSASERDDRSALDLFSRPAFQAIASCRAYEVSSDGSGINSPFTAALKKGLEHLPARTNFKSGLWATRLFGYLHPELKGQSDEQEPQFGILEGDGEFRFFPSNEKSSREHFASQLPRLDEQKLLQAAVTTSEGDWWFTERPWFVPSLRKVILERVTPKRSAEAVLIGRDRLRDITRIVVSEGLSVSAPEARAAGDASIAVDPLVPPTLKQLRYQHAKLLLDAEGTPSFKEVLGEIARELHARQAELEAPDLHLLAVLRHALNDQLEADAAFQLALNKYRGVQQENDLAADVPIPNDPTTATRPPRGNDNGFEFEKGLRALCLADYGEYLMQVKSIRQAAQRFREADLVFGEEAPAAFRIFVLCREAGAWLQENRWANADERLLDARYLAERFDSGHHLPAFVYRNLAWARMIQWRIEDAEYWFIASNRVLNESFAIDRGVQAQATDLIADQPPQLDAPSEVALAVEREPAGDGAVIGRSENPFSIDPEFHHWDNASARIMFLHNLHGLAMVQRFKGRTALAAEKYRWLAGEVNQALTDVTQETVNAESDLEAKLYGRLVNTLERLADCNLFGSPAERDLGEAIDDYRRALSRTHRMANSETTRAQLLYKLALSLALPPDRPENDTQDTELALATSQAADQIYQQTYAPVDTSAQDEGQTESRPSANGMILALGELTTKTVTLMATSQNGGSTKDTQLPQAVTELRDALQTFRERQGPNLHRDQLEICLFSARVLLDHACENDRFHLTEDAELLLSFCRLALAPDKADPRRVTGGPSSGEARAYLRPFYDTVMRGKLRAAPKHFKDLLEVQYEATNGREYMKQEKALPIMAFYVLDGKCYLLVDLPLSASKCYSLSDDYELDEIRIASTYDASNEGNSKLLPLPREVLKSLEQWRDAHVPEQEAISLICHWEDLVPATNFVHWGRESAEGTHVVAKPTTTRFPFELPNRFNRLTAESPRVDEAK